VNVRRERLLMRRAVREQAALRVDVDQHGADVTALVEQVCALRAVADAVLAELRSRRAAQA
jgi:hypothetical protein